MSAAEQRNVVDLASRRRAAPERLGSLATPSFVASLSDRMPQRPNGGPPVDFVALFREGREAAASGSRNGRGGWQESEEERNARLADLLEIEETRRQRAHDALLRLVPANRENTASGLSCLDEDQHPAELKEWLERPDRLKLILAGGTGSGKTHAAYAAMAEAVTTGCMGMRKGTEVRKFPYPEVISQDLYLEQLRPGGSPDAAWTIRERARTAGILILDDLGADIDNEATEHVRRELRTLLNERQEPRLRTIITTNCTSKMLSARLGHLLFSRLCEDATILKFTGRDRRTLTTEW